MPQAPDITLENSLKRFGGAIGLIAALSLVPAGLAGQGLERNQNVAPGSTAGGDTLALSLDDALRLALGQSQEVQLARSRVAAAEAQIGVARSMLFPQINASLGYTKTFASAFDSGGGSAFQLPDSMKFEPNPDLPLEERVAYLEDRAPIAGLMGIGALFSDLPFGQENTYTATLSGDQTVWSGGRTGAALRIARASRDAATYTLTEETADLELQVRTAYYQALLAQELEAISEAAVEQAEAFLEQERLRLSSGRASELEVLRAEVALENLRPQLVEATNAAELARLNLKRLTDIPASQPLVLTTTLSEDIDPAILAGPGAAETELQRASIAAAESRVTIAEANVTIVKGAYLPNVSLRMNYGKQAFPSQIFQLDNDWRTDWTASLNVSVPIFTGFRRRAEIAEARVQLDQARLQVAQLREAVQLEYEQARGERERARAAIAARQRTVEQAQRVHDLTVLRYDQGLATQLEVTDARLALLQSRTNLAQAIADYQIADAGVMRATGRSATDIP